MGLTLLIDFDDDPATIPQAEIVDFCNGDSYSGFGNNGSVFDYFNDNSIGRLVGSDGRRLACPANPIYPTNW